MSLGTYLRQNTGEYLLLLLSVWSVSVVGFNAYFLDSLLDSAGYAARAALALGVSAILLLALYAASYRRRRLVIGAIGYLLLLALLIGASLALSAGEDLYADTEGNYLYLALVMAVSATGGFLLTRTLGGSALWFLAAAFSCTVVQAFYQTGEVVLSVTASLSALALIVHRNFRLGLQNADVVRKASHSGTFVSSVTPVVASGALALLAWFVIIAPLDPSVMKITLITDYRQLPIEEFKGTADEHPTLSFELTSQELVEGFPYTTDDLKEDPNALVTIDAASVFEQQLQQQVEESAAAGSGAHDVLDPDSEEETFDPLSWSVVFPMIIVAIVVTVLVILAIVAYFVGRRLWRRRRLRRMLAQSPRAQIESLYLFTLSRLARLGFKVPRGMTLSEYAKNSARSMDMLTEETRVAFSELTEGYEAVSYGKCEPTEAEVVPFVAYYLGFWKAARTHLGNLRYFFKAFWL
jgi:ABC-type multidrug transport system fused ATPase/permease subunit